MTPWDLPKSVTASVVLDYHVKVGLPTFSPQPTDAQYDELYRARVRANELRRERAEDERPESIFLREQAI